MNKHSTSSPFNSQDFSDGWMDHPLVEWISTNRKILLWGLLGLFAAIFLSYRLISARTLKAESDYFRAEIAFQELQKTIQNKEKSAAYVNELTSIMERRPELHAKYDGALAQYFIIENQPEAAEKFARSTFSRIKPDQLKLFESYANTSLLITQGLYQEALQRSMQLQTQLAVISQDKFKGTLEIYNLLRVAILHQQLGQKEDELAAWETLLAQAEENTDTFLPIYQSFKSGQTTLGQYIDERKIH
ncbi:MAG: hypothetical protein H0V82_05915 [Candidatus Protochlamydia sp.]|nr:hypothetical protein [Candidatus Protochlamydia sp.]